MSVASMAAPMSDLRDPVISQLKYASKTSSARLYHSFFF
jgi:hypothetical protein